MNYEIKNRQLFIDGKSVPFFNPVDSALVFNDLLIVHSFPKGNTDANIVALDSSGKIKWRVAVPPILDSTGNWFCGIGVSEDHRLKGFLFYGVFYYIDSETGELTRGSPPGRAW